MKILKQNNWSYLVLVVVSACFMLSSLSAGMTNKAKHDFDKYFEQLPWLGLVSDEVTYGPITVSNIHINDSDKVVIAAPGEVLHGSLKYKIDSGDLSAFHGYHLVIGLKDEGAQDCVTHSLGLWDSKGKARFQLTAPQKAGVYEVRFIFVEGLTCSAARDLWSSGEIVPGSNVTIGVVIVE